MLYPPAAVIESILAAIRLDPACQQMLGARVHDAPPGDRPITPYVYLGGLRMLPVTDMGDCADHFRFQLRLFCVADEFGRVQAWDAAWRVLKALRKTRPDIDPSFRHIADLQVAAAGDAIDPQRLKETYLDITAVIGVTPA